MFSVAKWNFQFKTSTKICQTLKERKINSFVTLMPKYCQFTVKWNKRWHWMIRCHRLSEIIFYVSIVLSPSPAISKKLTL